MRPPNNRIGGQALWTQELRHGILIDRFDLYSVDAFSKALSFTLLQMTVV